MLRELGPCCYGSGTLAMMPASILATSRLGAAGAAITFSMIIPRDIILRRSDVLYTLRSRPAVRNDLEIPPAHRKDPWSHRGHLSLWIRGAAGPCPCPSARVAARQGRPGTGHYKSATNNESQRSRNALHNLRFPQNWNTRLPQTVP